MSNEHLAYISGHETIKEGWVTKRAGLIFKSWERRWFLLRGDKLYYYKNDEMAKTYPQLPRNTFHIKKAEVYRAAEGKIESPTEWCIEILFHPSVSAQLDHPKSYYFCVDGEKDMEEWIAALEKARHFVGHLPATLESRPAQSKSAESSSSSSSGWGSMNISPLSPYDAAANMMAGYSNSGPKVDESEAVLRLILPQLDDFYNTKRTIIRRGAMEVADVSVDGDHKKKKRFTILLNGILLVTKRKESCYILKIHISLSLSPVVEKSLPNPNEIIFKTKTNNRVFSFTLENEELRDRWAKDLTTAIAEATSSSDQSEAMEDSLPEPVVVDEVREQAPASDQLPVALQIGEL
eukprot:TRINITY_DN11121_c0_g1_i1.p1 TRINITY_DN11121_c0_g1~~TRINITY_DN11121_c0_g1_i1.p1  ORF type:complete len:350 (+),score=127.85 TRINITY_DN11121_c0_g1_i1:20-1069(+)